jgi:hypothetical protein
MRIIPGTYQHYKGRLYRVLFVATHTETQESFVVYKDINESKYWIRPKSMFTNFISVKNHLDNYVVKRFTLIKSE